MARLIRICYPGAWYHVMNRGVDHQPIFTCVKHREMFLHLCQEISERFHVQIHAYCLMGNHYHLMIHTPEGNLSQAIHYLDSVYAIRYNKCEGRDGPLFRGRFNAQLVDDEVYLLKLSQYIHLNPVKAEIVNYAEDYPWSSCAAYVGSKESPVWLYKDVVLAYFAKSGYNTYRQYIDEDEDSEMAEFFSSKPVSPILGSKRFNHKVKQFLEKTNKEALEQFRCLHERFSFEDIITVVSLITGQTVKEILTSTRGTRNVGRMLVAYISREQCRYGLVDVAEQMNISNLSTITMAVKRMETLLTKDVDCQSLLALCLVELRARESEALFGPPESE